MQIVCIPIYIRFLGIEAFGLIGFYLVLQSLLQILDFGLSPTINRETARYSVQPDKAAEARDLVRTLEVVYWMVGIGIGVDLGCGALNCQALDQVQYVPDSECSASRNDNGHSGVLPVAAEFLSRRLDGVGPTSSLKCHQDLAECPR